MYILAYYWLSLSKDPRAKQNLLYLESIMTPEQMKKAREMIQKHKENVNGEDERISGRGTNSRYL